MGVHYLHGEVTGVGVGEERVNSVQVCICLSPIEVLSWGHMTVCICMSMLLNNALAIKICCMCKL